MTPIISIEDLSYAYPSVRPTDEPVWVLDGIDLTINPGEFVAIMGPTGVGKSTLCLALNGIVPHSKGGVIGGRVFINSRDSRQLTVAELSQTVGLVFQKPDTQLFNMTVEAEVAFGLETLGLPPAEMHRRIDWALAQVGMTGFRKRSPFELSGGQKQRVAIAAVLAMKPPVLVLDEPTANLDPVGKREVFAAVDALRQREGMTIIMVSHESEQIAAFAGRVVVLNEGKVVQDGPPAQVFAPESGLTDFGLSVPQVSRLAGCLNQHQGTNFAFTTVVEAGRALRGALPAADPLNGQAADAGLPAEAPGTARFRLENVSYDYTSQHFALRDISLTIGRGEFAAILGQNGSGKTTLVKHLNGLLRPTHGRVLLDGVDIAGTPVAELAQTVGYVFQNPDHMIFSETVRQELAAGPRNLGLPEGQVTERVEKALDQFGLRPYADQQPALLSFGLRRKVSVAAVVAMETDVLILDEPTSGLDQRGTDELMDVISDLNRDGVTILLITHDMKLVAEHVPRTIVLHGGRLAAHDCTRRIFESEALIEKTQLESPQITQLGRILGMGGAVLSVGELCGLLARGRQARQADSEWA